MSQLKELINGQDITFDTHQAGDGQIVNWKNVHLEKSMHKEKGKVRFPLLNEEKISKTKNMNDETFYKIKKEVSKVLKKDKNKVKELAKTIVEILDRYSSQKSTEQDAFIASEKLCDYFD